MTRCMSRDAAKVLKCSKVSQPATVTVIHRNLPKGTVERSSFCCKNIVHTAREVLQDGAEVMVRTKSDV